MTTGAIEQRTAIPLPRLGLGARAPDVLGLLVMLLGMGIWVSAYVQWYVVNLPTSREEVVLSRAVQTGDLQFLLLAIVLAPIFEELLFRFGIFELLRRRAIQWPFAISVLTFTAMHPTLWAAPVAALMGIVLAGVYVRYRSYGLCVALHALWNCQPWIAGVLLRFRVPGYWSFLAGRTEPAPAWLLTGGAILLAAGAWPLVRA